MKLKVTGRIEKSNKPHYTVDYNNSVYYIPLFKFQEPLPTPGEIECIILDNDGRTKIKQDITPLLEGFYTVGNEYPFIVRNDFSRSGYYEIADKNGFYFHLQSQINNKEINLYIGQEIWCRVNKISGIKVELSLIRNKREQTSGTSANNIYKYNDDFNSDTITSFITDNLYTDKSLPEWGIAELFDLVFINEGDYSPLVNRWILDKIKHISSETNVYDENTLSVLQEMLTLVKYVLEETDCLKSIEMQQRQILQLRMSIIGQHLKSYIKVIKIFIEGKEEELTDKTLTNLHISGYIFEAQKQLDLIMRIFSLRRDIMSKQMPRIFEIIHSENESFWRTEPFRKAFINLLELYISENKQQVDIATSSEDLNVLPILEALSLQLILADPTEDHDVFDFNLNRAMLYRYASYMTSSTPRSALQNAFYSLMDVINEKRDYTWNDTKQHDLLASKVSARVNCDSNVEFSKNYLANGLSLRISEEMFVLEPARNYKHNSNVLPADMLKWNNIQIRVDQDIKQPNVKKVNNLSEYQAFWKDIELAMFETKKDAPKIKKIPPTQGDIYNIRIVSYLHEEERLYCQIISDEVEGYGYIAPKDIVGYNFSPHISQFRNNEGDYFVFEAKVVNIDSEGYCHFTASKLIHDYMSNDSISFTNTCPVLITSVNKLGLLGVSQHGVSVRLENYENYPNISSGDIVMATYWEKDKALSFKASIINDENPMGIYFSVDDAIHTLMGLYSHDIYADEEEQNLEVTQQSDTLDKLRIEELMNIIDRVAVLESDYKTSYNYLAMARIMSKIIDSKERELFYDGWMKLIFILHYFALNGVVSSKDLLEFENNNAHLFDHKSEIYKRYIQLKIISYKDKENSREALWEHTTSDDEISRKLAENVLAYNLLSDSGVSDVRHQISEKIQDLLKVKNQSSELENFGEEDLHKEFKTSIVYPSGTMQPNLPLQTAEIMKEICAMLNADGGKLYIGVSDYGIGIGMEADLKYKEFNGVKDKYDNYVRNQIRITLGKDADAYINSTFLIKSGRTIYELTIKPYPHVARYEGVIYERHGTSKISLKDENEALFLSRKNVTKNSETEHVGVSEKPKSVIKPKESVEERPMKSNTYEHTDKIATSVRRKKTMYSYEEEMPDVERYIQFMDSTYQLTSDYFPEAPEDGILLTLPIRSEDENKYLVLAYENGTICTISISTLLEKGDRQKYSRYVGSPLMFADIAEKEDAIMTITANKKGGHQVRFDSITNLDEINSMTDSGSVVTNVAVEKYIRYDLITGAEKLLFREIMDTSLKQVGRPLYYSDNDHVYSDLKKIKLL
jgi:hypothetical protein